MRSDKLMMIEAVVVRLGKRFGDNKKSPTTYAQAYLLCFAVTECL